MTTHAHTNPKRFPFHKGWKVILNSLGLEVEPVLDAAGLPTDLMQRKGASISAAEFFSLQYHIEQLSVLDDIPVRVAESLSLEVFSPAMLASACSVNLNEALQRMDQFSALIGPTLFDLDIGEQFTEVVTAVARSLSPSGYMLMAGAAVT